MTTISTQTGDEMMLKGCPTHGDTWASDRPKNCLMCKALRDIRATRQAVLEHKRTCAVCAAGGTH